MSTPALITMLVALLLVWGGLAVAIGVAVVGARRQRAGRGPGS